MRPALNMDARRSVWGRGYNPSQYMYSEAWFSASMRCVILLRLRGGDARLASIHKG